MPISWFADSGALQAALARTVARAETVLDIGCGIQPQDYIVPNVHICCEPFGQYVDYLLDAIQQKKQRLFYDRRYVVLQADWEETVKVVASRSVDAVYVMDVIEHLEKGDGVRLLKATEQLITQQLVLFTPLGFVPQEHPDGKDAWGLDGGHMQRHKSGWWPEDFDASWDILACKTFHLVDNVGRPRDTPAGAFYAIKTVARSPARSLSVLETLDLAALRVADRLPAGRDRWRRLKQRTKRLMP